MRDELKFAVLLGRLLELIRTRPETSPDHRSALHALVDLSAQRSVSVRLRGGLVSVEGVDVPDDTPFAVLLRDRMAAHGIARINLTHGASAVDLVQLLRLLAANADGADPAAAFEEHLRRAKVTTVSVVTAELDSAVGGRSDVRVTEALRVGEKARVTRATATDLNVVPAAEGAAFEEMQRLQRAQANTLVAAVARLQDEHDGDMLLNRLDAVQAAIFKALNSNELNQGFEAILRLIRQESEIANPDTQRAYGIALRRILIAETLKRFLPLVQDEVYRNDIVTVMRRAGTPATKLLLDSLIEAPSQAERRAHLSVLRQIEQGADVISSLLSHHQWYVVRNAADLVGEMRLVEAVADLGKVIQHEDARVRRSVGLALARIGTPETAIHLRKALTDPDREVRLAVAKELGGSTLGGLAMPLVSAADAEEDETVLAEFYRALGRIGTPDAVQALTKAASAGGLLSRKPVGPRLAAIEALGTAGSPAAFAALKELAGGRGEVKAAASAALAKNRA